MAERDEREGPDLSRLPLDMQLRIAVARTEGGRWVGIGATRRGLYMDGHGYTLRMTDDGYGVKMLAGLPDYLNDPAEWGALMERELKGWERSDDGRTHLAFYISQPPRIPCRLSERAATLPRAVCLAVLAKHCKDTSRYTSTQEQGS